MNRLLQLINTKLSLSVLNPSSGAKMKELNNKDTQYFADVPTVRTRKRMINRIIGRKAEDCKLPGIKAEHKEMPKENVDANISKSPECYYGSSFKKGVRKVTQRALPRVNVRRRRLCVANGRLVLPNDSNYDQIVTFVNDVKDIVHPDLTPLRTKVSREREEKSVDKESRGCRLTLESIRKSNLGLKGVNRRNVIKDLINTSVINTNLSMLARSSEKSMETWTSTTKSLVFAKKLHVQNEEQIFLYPSLKQGLKEAKLNLAIRDVLFVINLV
eukprot:TRINITY_DN11324_c0_g1_i11.p1 TRINITY_DN11324_c0_g1~~TRINITY_DN11324_c0_g1_i11.p1  ORF type:complete len:272 (-),score=52.54 TRINITY_DN11324_c0_g1_i11:134-949(-)